MSEFMFFDFEIIHMDSINKLVSSLLELLRLTI